MERWRTHHTEDIRREGVKGVERKSIEREGEKEVNMNGEG